jgi:hypothetical protein
MPVAEWMRGLLGFRIPDESIASVLAKRNVDGSAPLSAIEQREAELLRADLFVWCCLAPSTGQVVEDADGNWRHREGGYSLAPRDKDGYLAMANSVYKKYGEDVVRVRRPIKIIHF